jgi:hypothetical protein
MEQFDNIQEQVNKVVSLMPWCDCDVVPSTLGNFTIACSEDLTYFHTIEITFVDVLHVHCRYDFHIDPVKGLFRRQNEDKLPVVVDKSALDDGYYEFIIEDEDAYVHTIIARGLNVSYDNVLRYYRQDLNESQRLANWVTPPR